MPANTAAPTSKDGPVSLGSKPVSQPSQKSMTKAERRELQERQRAAKLAQKQQPQGPSNAAASSSKSKQTSTPQKKAADTNKPATSLGKDASIAAKDAALSVAAAADSVEAQKSRGLRIFSHFGAPKPLGAGVKGDIHPANRQAWSTVLRIQSMWCQCTLYCDSFRVQNSEQPFTLLLFSAYGPPGHPRLHDTP